MAVLQRPYLLSQILVVHPVSIPTAKVFCDNSNIIVSLQAGSLSPAFADDGNLKVTFSIRFDSINCPYRNCPIHRDKSRCVGHVDGRVLNCGTFLVALSQKSRND